MLSQLRDKPRFSTIICYLSIHLLCGTRSPVWCLKPNRVVKRQFSRSTDPEQAEIQMAQTWESRGKRPVATSLLFLVPGLSNDGVVHFVWTIAWV